MKKFNSFLIMTLGVVIIFSSCKKEDEKYVPIPDFILGEELDINLSSAADSLALQMMDGFILTKVRKIDPLTGEPLPVDPLTGDTIWEWIQTPITADRQYRIIGNLASEANWNLANKVQETKAASDDKILFGFPAKSQTNMLFYLPEGQEKTYADILGQLNDISVVADNGLTIIQMIDTIFATAEEKIITAAMAYCRGRIIYYNGGKKNIPSPSKKEIKGIIQKRKRG